MRQINSKDRPTSLLPRLSVFLLSILGPASRRVDPVFGGISHPFIGGRQTALIMGARSHVYWDKNHLPSTRRRFILGRGEFRLSGVSAKCNELFLHIRLGRRYLIEHGHLERLIALSVSFTWTLTLSERCNPTMLPTSAAVRIPSHPLRRQCRGRDTSTPVRSIGPYRFGRWAVLHAHIGLSGWQRRAPIARVDVGT